MVAFQQTIYTEGRQGGGATVGDYQQAVYSRTAEPQ